MSNLAKANPAFGADLSSVLVAADEAGLADHVLFQTSGTEGSPKWVALSQEALECSAAAVNGRLEVGSSDIWLRVLGDYHVGGYGIGVRAGLAGATVRELPGKWSPADCLRSLDGATLCSLVPTQLYDLVQLRARPPGSLRAVLVGGAALSPDLREDALRLDWPVHDTYGMTEAGSTVAIDGELLPIWQARLGQAGCLELKGGALFSGYLIDEGAGWQWRRSFDADGWFASSDNIVLKGRRISVRGRLGDVVQVLGENVDLGALQSLLEGLAGQCCAVAAVADARSGNRLVLVWEIGSELDKASLLADYNSRVAGFERILNSVEIEEIPRTALGKVRRGVLDQMLENSRLA
jgi:O-succinylbenzoic acid--CoA ligase